MLISLWMAPRVGFEPTTDRLTADCSATELPRNVVTTYFACSNPHNARFEPTSRPPSGELLDCSATERPRNVVTTYFACSNPHNARCQPTSRPPPAELPCSTPT